MRRELYSLGMIASYGVNAEGYRTCNVRFGAYEHTGSELGMERLVHGTGDTDEDYHLRQHADAERCAIEGLLIKILRECATSA